MGIAILKVQTVSNTIVIVEKGLGLERSSYKTTPTAGAINSTKELCECRWFVTNFTVVESGRMTATGAGFKIEDG